MALRIASRRLPHSLTGGPFGTPIGDPVSVPIDRQLALLPDSGHNTFFFWQCTRDTTAVLLDNPDARVDTSVVSGGADIAPDRRA